ncbi:MAG: FGGY-family carbohydrate kinase, partial [Candidatus Thorarchaeota archaeon]
VMDCQKITDISQALMMFPQPALPQVTPLDSSRMIHAVLENIAYAIRGNVEQLEVYGKSSGVKTIGGMSRSETWPQLLANILNRPVSTTIQFEGSLMGAAICAATGAGYHPSIDASVKAMIKWRPTYQPDERSKLYDRYYSKWNELRSEGE